jgi:hypothetical protein
MILSLHHNSNTNLTPATTENSGNRIMKKDNLKSEPIYFFRSERNTQYNHGFYNPSKFFVEIVNQISFRDIMIVPFVGVTSDNGNKMDITAKEIRDFENGRLSRLVFNWDNEYDTSFYIRESGLTDSEKAMTKLFESI